MEDNEIKLEKQQLFRYLKEKGVFRKFITNFKKYHYEYNLSNGYPIHKNNENIDCLFKRFYNPIKCGFSNFDMAKSDGIPWEEYATEYQNELLLARLLRQQNKNRLLKTNVQTYSDAHAIPRESVTEEQLPPPTGKILFFDFMSRIF